MEPLEFDLTSEEHSNVFCNTDKIKACAADLALKLEQRLVSRACCGMRDASAAATTRCMACLALASRFRFHLPSYYLWEGARTCLGAYLGSVWACLGACMLCVVLRMHGWHSEHVNTRIRAYQSCVIAVTRGDAI